MDIGVSVGLLEAGKEEEGRQNVNSGGRTGLGHVGGGLVVVTQTGGGGLSFGGGLVTPAGGGGLYGGGGLQLGGVGLGLNQPDTGAATCQKRLKGEVKLEDFDKAQLK